MNIYHSVLRKTQPFLGRVMSHFSLSFPLPVWIASHVFLSISLLDLLSLWLLQNNHQKRKRNNNTSLGRVLFHLGIEMRQWVLQECSQSLQPQRLKQTVGDNFGVLWEIIGKYHNDECPNMIKLAHLALSCPVQTAGCERGFSAQNLILSPRRNKLGDDTMDMLLRVKLNKCDINHHYVYRTWKAAKPRRN